MLRHHSQRNLAFIPGFHAQYSVLIKLIKSQRSDIAAISNL